MVEPKRLNNKTDAVPQDSAYFVTRLILSQQQAESSIIPEE
jgi:hypothetical protein